MNVGVLGGGQLSRMLALAGIPLGLNFIFYEPRDVACVKHLGKVFNSPYADDAALDEFLSVADVVTYENENIPIAILQSIAEQNTVYPGVNALQIMQDRLLEKRFFNSLDIPTTQFFAVDDIQQLETICDQVSLPIVLKKRKNSYDGKGQKVIKNIEELSLLEPEQYAEAIVEEFINFDREVSLIACRDKGGNFAFYDICENFHSNGILIHTNNKPNDVKFAEAKSYLAKIMQSLDYVGVCALEFFEMGGKLIANELAPRVHNTGHWTIEGAVISQFENHLRSILGYTLGQTSSLGEFAMYNIIGNMPDKAPFLDTTNIHFHDYGKIAKPGRKLGHLNLNKYGNGGVLGEIASMLR